MTAREILDRMESLNVTARNLCMEAGSIVVEMRGLVIELQREQEQHGAQDN